MSNATAEATDLSSDNYPLCSYDELPNRSAKAITLTGAGATGAVESLPLIVVRWDDQVYGYINRCPHASVPLDERVPGRFFNPEHSYLICDRHGALFEVDTGECFDGPCQGKGLTVLRVGVIDGMVCLLGVKYVEVEGAAAQ